MKKHLLLIFALISLISLMSFTVDYGQKPKEQTQKVGMLSDIVGAPIIIAPPPSTITVFRGSNVSFKVTFISDLQVDGVLTKINRTREKKAGNWEIMQFVGRLFNTQRASVVVMRS